jgi:CheY-like chemotaxis protein
MPSLDGNKWIANFGADISMPLFQYPNSQAKQSPASKRLRILVVEDDFIIAMLLGETLADIGHEVCAVVATEQEAVAAAAQYLPDLLIVDARLREGDGISAVDRILSTGFVPHVFVSGDRLGRELLNVRAVTLDKPYQEKALIAAIARAIASPAVVSGHPG